MKKYILYTVATIGVIALFLFNRGTPENKIPTQDALPAQNVLPEEASENATDIKKPAPIVQQDPVSYRYSTDLLAKFPLQNRKIELYSAGETYEGTVLLGTVIFPEMLIRKEDAALIGMEKCSSDKTEKLVACQVTSFNGIAITSYPESYKSLVEKFTNQVCRFEKNCSQDISIGGREGKTFTSQFELEGRNYYLLPSNVSGKTLVAQVDFNWNNAEQTKFMNEQIGAILSSAKLE